MLDLDAGAPLEHLGAEMRERAYPGGGVCQLVGILPGIFDQIRDRPHLKHLGIDRQRLRHRAKQRYRHEIPDGIIRELGVHARDDREAHIRYEEVVAVRGLTSHVRRGNRAAGARPGLHYHRDFPLLGQLLCDGTGNEVGTAACGVEVRDRDRLVGERICLRRSHGCAAHEQYESHKRLHAFLLETGCYCLLIERSSAPYGHMYRPPAQMMRSPVT